MKKEYIEVKAYPKQLLTTIDEYCNNGWKYLECVPFFAHHFYTLIFERNIVTTEVDCFVEIKDNRAETLSKHPGYNYIAMDSDGDWYVYKERPNYIKNGRYYSCSLYEDESTSILWKSVDGVIFNGKSEESLYQKPEEVTDNRIQILKKYPEHNYIAMDKGVIFNGEAEDSLCSKINDNRLEVLKKFPEYNYICMNKNKKWHLFKNRPKNTDNYFNWDYCCSEDNVGLYNGVLLDVIFKGSSEDSLLERPKVWVKANQSHVGKEFLEIRYKDHEDNDWTGKESSKLVYIYPEYVKRVYKYLIEIKKEKSLINRFFCEVLEWDIS